VLDRLIPQYAARGSLLPAVSTESAEVPRARTLAHPSKLWVASSATLFVADTGHHRVLQLELDDEHRSARIERVFGTGSPGFADGALDAAQFRDPRGIVGSGSTIYVADTGNHAVRAIDAASGEVRTIAGTGVIGHGAVRASGASAQIALRSPWSVWLDRPRLFVALAGSHQIAVVEDERELRPFAGDGAERLADGPALAASFNQPSDLVGVGGALFVADPEASAIRRVECNGKPVVETLVGRGLFDWGDVDGFGQSARLQHPLGLALDGLLYVADTYNHRIKHMDVETRQIAALAGTGAAGHLDGGFGRARFRLPEGLAVRGRHLFVADTGNHAIRICDLGARAVWTLAIAD
jgi:sugar lactone lactonase YvrE